MLHRQIVKARCMHISTLDSGLGGMLVFDVVAGCKLQVCHVLPTQDGLMPSAQPAGDNRGANTCRQQCRRGAECKRKRRCGAEGCAAHSPAAAADRAIHAGAARETRQDRSGLSNTLMPVLAVDSVGSQECKTRVRCSMCLPPTSLVHSRRLQHVESDHMVTLSNQRTGIAFLHRQRDDAKSRAVHCCSALIPSAMLIPLRHPLALPACTAHYCTCAAAVAVCQRHAGKMEDVGHGRLEQHSPCGCFGLHTV